MAGNQRCSAIFLPLLRFDGNGYPSPHRKIRGDLAPAGGQGLDQVVQDRVGRMFVEDPLVPERPQVKFERFGLQDLSVGGILNGQTRKIGLPRRRADTGEFIGAEGDDIIPGRMVVRKRFQLLYRLFPPAEQGQSLQVGFFSHLRHRIPSFELLSSSSWG
jgi:hypothetical protein